MPLGDINQESRPSGRSLMGVMRNAGTDLLLVVIFTLITLVFIYAPGLDGTIVRSALGLIMILFVPGYSFIAALFPGKVDLDNIERVALAFGLSIAIVPLIGLALNFTQWGIRMEPIVVCLTIFTLVCVAVAGARRLALPAGDRFSVDFRGAYKNLREDMFNDKTPLDKALTIVLILAILLSVSVVAYFILVPQQGEKFTEFYILGPNGKADNYPTRFNLGDTRPVLVGIANHEARDVPYSLVVSLNNSITSSMLYSTNVTLADNQTWEQPVNVTPDKAGTNMKLEFLLYADGNYSAPYRECHLWINVTS